MVAAVPRRLARPGHCRLLHGTGLRIVHAVAFVSVCCAISSPNAVSDLDERDFPVTGDVGNRQSQTKDEAEAELVRELAKELQQFDRFLDRQKATAGTPAGDSVSQAADARGAAVASSGDGGQNPGDGVERTLPGGGTLKRAGDPIAAVGDESGTERDGQSLGLPTGPATSDPVAAATGTARTEGPGRPGGSAGVPENVMEDDIARILREAAQRETDPTRRAALWKEYENYVKNL